MKVSDTFSVWILRKGNRRLFRRLSLLQGLMSKPSAADRERASAPPDDRDPRVPSSAELAPLEERLQLLELLTSAGVAMSGSFDIRDILHETHRVASRVLKALPVEVLYCGRSSINSRSLWFPAEPIDGGLTEAARDALEARLALAVESGGSYEAIVAPLLGPNRAALPLSHQEELLGVLFFERPTPRGDDAPAAGQGRMVATRLLGILTQQAATALRNIHLTQERIHFERLSAIGRMIGTIVHDLRSPLTALRGYASMLTTLELDETERREYGGWILEECDRLNQMVAELLEFTRGGRAELLPDWFDLTDYLRGLTDRLDRHYRSRGIRVELFSEYKGKIRADRLRLERALTNVATNACQAMPGGGTLTIRAREAGADRKEVVLEIEDEGSGIPEEIRHRIFEPFFSYGKSEGIGLGMATARRIVEEHDGRIEIGDAPGPGRRGALLRFRLPIEGPGSEVELAAEGSTRQARGLD